MPDAELFEFPVSLSPRLVWMRTHGVNVFKLDPPDGRWACVKGNVTGLGASDNEAICDFCEKSGVKHWSLNE